jgi:hypothetical protein
MAMGHWLLVETGARPRPVFVRPDVDAGGVTLVEGVHRRATGLPSRLADAPGAFMRYEAIAYGWPIANWATVFRQREAFYWQTGVDPIIAIDVRGLWPPSDLPDPYRPTLTKQQITTQCAAGACPPTNGTDAYQRFLPIFPLVGQSMLASVLYGLPCYVWLKRRELRRRRGHCVSCGYDCSGLFSCPECGSTIPPTAVPSSPN